MTEETKPQEAPSWSKEDLAYLKHIPEEMHHLVARHGRQLFSLVMGAGAAAHGLNILARQGAGNRAAMKAITVLGQAYDGCLKTAVTALGKTPEAFNECKNDIELLAALKDTGTRKPGDRVSKGGILLDS